MGHKSSEYKEIQYDKSEYRITVAEKTTWLLRRKYAVAHIFIARDSNGTLANDSEVWFSPVTAKTAEEAQKLAEKKLRKRSARKAAKALRKSLKVSRNKQVREYNYKPKD